MKKLLSLLSAMAMVAIVVSITLTPFSLSSQQKSRITNATIPEKVMTIVKVSCLACHSDKGEGLAPASINFSQWDTYTAKKQFKKASAMCREITNGTMPPAEYLAKNPAAKLNADKIAIICNWATSIKPAE